MIFSRQSFKKAFTFRTHTSGSTTAHPRAVAAADQRHGIGEAAVQTDSIHDRKQLHDVLCLIGTVYNDVTFPTVIFFLVSHHFSTRAWFVHTKRCGESVYAGRNLHLMALLRVVCPTASGAIAPPTLQDKQDTSNLS